MFLSDPHKDVLREISHLKTVIKSSTSLSGEFPQIHFIFHNLSLCFQINTLCFANLLMNHINKSIFSTTENDNIQKEEEKDQIYFQEISKDW